MRVTVIGAGVAGLTTALDLAERGCAVEVIDRGPSLGAACCSRLAGGMLAPGASGRVPRSWSSSSAGRRSPGGRPGIPARSATAASCWRPGATRRSWSASPGAPGGSSAWTPTGWRRSSPPSPGASARGCSSPTRRTSTRGRRWPRSRRGWRSSVPASASASTACSCRPRPTVVDCRGLAARDRLEDLRGVKGEMLLLRCPDVALARPVRLLHPAFRSTSCRAARACSWSAPP